jgi:hypothetical protein
MAHPRRRRQAPLLWDGTRHPKGVYTAGSWIRLSIQAPEPSEQSMGFVNTRVPWRNRIDRDGKAKYTDDLNPTSVPNMCFFPSPTPFVHEWTLAKMQYTASHTAPDEPKTQSTYIYTFLFQRTRRGLVQHHAREFHVSHKAVKLLKPRDTEDTLGI